MTTAPPLLAEPLPFRMMLDEAVTQVRRHFKAAYLPVAAPLAIVGGLMPIAQAVLMRRAAQGQGEDAFAVLAGFLAFMALILLTVVLYVAGQTALMAAATDALAGRELSMLRAWRFAFRPRTVLTLVLSWLVVTVGFVFCILPGIYLALLFSVLVPVMLEEGRAWANALGRTSELMRYNPHRDLGHNPCVRAFVVLLVGALIGYVVSFVAQFPFLAAQWVVMFRNIASGEKADPQAMMAGLLWLQVPAGIMGMLAHVAVQLYVCFGLTLLFFDLKHRKEGGDLEAAIAALAPSPAPPEPPA